MTAEATADNTSIQVFWEWPRQSVLLCFDSVRVDYQPEGGSLMMYTVDSAIATSATLSNLPCNTQYTITVVAVGGRTGTRRLTTVVSLPARGIVAQLFTYVLSLLTHHVLPLQPLLLPLRSLAWSP